MQNLTSDVTFPMNCIMFYSISLCYFSMLFFNNNFVFSPALCFS